MASGPSILMKFLSDTSNLTSGVDKATTGMLGSLKSFALKAGGVMAATFAAKEIVDFGKASIDAFTADAEGQAQLAAALKNTTQATDDQIAASEKYIANLSKTAAIADDDLRPALATLARGFKDPEEAQRALTIAVDAAAGSGKDLASVSQAMMKAANGQTTALGRMGVATKDAEGNALSLDQVMGNMAATFHGQAAVAADTAAGKMRNASIQFGEFQEKVGALLVPVLLVLVNVFTEQLLPAIDSVVGFIQRNGDAVIAVLIALGVAGVAAIVPLIPMFALWALNAALAAAATIAAAAPLIAIGLVVAGLAYLVIHNWDTIKAATEVAFKAVKDAVMTAFNWVKDNWPLLLAIITGPIGLAVLAVTKNWDTIKDAAKAVWDWISSNWAKLTEIVAKPIQSAQALVVAAWDAMKAGATAVWDWIKQKFDAIAGIMDSVVGAIKAAAERVANAIKAPINAVINAWNSLSFQIPTIHLPEFDTHIPGVGKIGGGTIGGQRFDFPNLPTLASGGVLTSPTLFVGGESGTEIVAPEDMLRRIVAEESGGGDTYVLNLYPRTADAADVAYAFRRLELMAGAL
jgi:hypothetical protein